ncbi:MAG: LysR family transcriptional regulator [Candidatus Sphingomonas colombiensis]|nr:LysR family transcriptional regulator [Sphingomonas sp.]WEK42369.1 MAG: LysR family transcriptional regulator [Sphingomonas sp.]
MHAAHINFMDLKRLRHAVGLADSGSFTAAAALLHISQPALSRSIQALEQEFGIELFRRTAAGVATTNAGAEIVSQARILLRHAVRLVEHASHLAGAEAGLARIGVGPMFADFLAPFLRDQWQPMQQMRLQVHVLPVESLIDRLLSEELDFFVADGSIARRHPVLRLRTIGEAAIRYYVRPDHPLAGCIGVDTETLTRFPLASPNLPTSAGSDDSALRETMRSRAGQIHCEQLSTLVDLVTASDGVLLAMEPAVAAQIASGRLVVLDVPAVRDWVASIAIVRLAARDPSPLAERLASAFERLLRERWFASGTSEGAVATPRQAEGVHSRKTALREGPHR